MKLEKKQDWSSEGAIARGKERIARLDELSKLSGTSVPATKPIPSKAPKPIEAIRSSGYVKVKPGPEPIDWAYWLKLPEVKVFEAIALLFNTEPESEPPDRDDASPEYHKTLRLLVASLADRLMFTPGTLNMGDPAMHGVRLSQVGTWAVALGYKLPNKFPYAIKPKELPELIKTVANSYSAPSHAAAPSGDPIPKVAPVSPIFSMTKYAMIQAHKDEWPTIEADIASAAANGLKAAKAGARGWREDAAMEWARTKGKLLKANIPTDLLAKSMNRMIDLPGEKHTQSR